MMSLRLFVAINVSDIPDITFGADVVDCNS
jgi:hypothetical protein